MQRKTITWWISTALVIMLLTLTGCQAIQGLDVAQALQNSATIHSAESSGSLKLDILTSNTDGLSADEKRIIDVLKDMKIDLTSIVMQDQQHVSVEGSLTYAKGSIPFLLTTNGTQLVIQIEGAKKPISFDLSEAQTGLPTTALASGDQQQLFMQKTEQMLPAIMKFFITNAPNPEHFTVSSVSETIHNETMGLQKAHIEIFGNELEALLKTFMTNILADEKGLKDLIGQLYDALFPLIQEQMKATTAKDDTSSGAMSDMFMPYLENRTLAVEFIYTTLQQLIGSTLKDWDKQMKSTFSSVSDPQQAAFFTDKASLKTDLFIDMDKQIRKMNVELTAPIVDASSPGIEGIRLTFTTELWHINQPVTARTIDISKGTQKASMDSFDNSSLLTLFDKNSKAYSLLRQDFQIAKKDIHLLLNQSETELHPWDASHPFINEEQIAMLPVRFISEQFGAQVTWNAAAQQITIVDPLSEKTIILTLGSRTASVNGVSVELVSPAILKNGSTFVPLRFIAEQLGCTVSYDEATQSVTISRN
ncbi:hypothetical protein A8709_09910 [Paenibacillus pectinilyticus]|uniref:Copper amine oxidase-like N-terminal domain-containing protein n=1 Tax=Paenibacillus pectinilyticus TaxID=512399 RepID=A0A1C1A5W3_9BACL|nr:copper amine oxidase N-terminal domain-containing protein [Paenibacillus pectinilyticus]OCT15929.1 hypothetical protein A8709_09910 [Paenibacillus pectinilyticus]